MKKQAILKENCPNWPGVLCHAVLLCLLKPNSYHFTAPPRHVRLQGVGDMDLSNDIPEV